MNIDFVELPPETSEPADSGLKLPPLPAIRSLSEISNEDMVPPPVLIEGMLYRGGKLVLSGASKGRKTFKLIHLAAAVANGADWLGFPTRKTGVLFVDAELMPFETPKRFKSVMEAANLWDESGIHIWNLRGSICSLGRLKPELLEFTKAHDIGLIVLDPFYRLSGGAEENSNTEIATFLAELESLAVDTGAAVAMAHHFAKGNAGAKNSIDRASGAGTFARDPDAILTMTEGSGSSESEPLFVIESSIRSFKPIPPFAIRWEFPIWKRDDEASTSLKGAGGAVASGSVDDILSIIQPEGTDAGTVARLASVEFGLSRKRVFELLSDGITSGRIENRKDAADNRKSIYFAPKG